MKKLIFGLILTGTLSSFAGDLNLSCFKNNDTGENIVGPREFMKQNKLVEVIKEKNKTHIIIIKKSVYLKLEF